MVPLDLDDTTYSWTNILEARHSLDRLMNNAMGFIRQAGIERSAERAYLQPQQQLLLQDYSIWIASFEALMGKSWKRIKVVDGRTPLVLRITYLASLIWLETCLSVDEMIFDHHNDSFDQLVRYAKEYIDINDSLNQSSNGTPPDSFTLEAGIVTPLFYTAVRCRNPITRREAIRLLSSCHVKEGLWNTKQMVNVAEAVLEMEESNLLSLPVEQRIPADRDRVYEALMPNEGTPVEVIFLSRPDGREWCTRTRLVY
ncbi:hypothetical protein MW887_004354 [Aspergillus wentii]|nr:hypothetical protein MW887_004354 [Aspergillus wentii]